MLRAHLDHPNNSWIIKLDGVEIGKVPIMLVQRVHTKLLGLGVDWETTAITVWATLDSY